MEFLTVAVKANWAALIPSLLAVTYVKEKDPDSNIATEIQDVEFLGPEKEPISFKTGDGNTLYGDAIISYIRNRYKLPPVEYSTQVDEWIQRSLDFTTTDFKSLEKSMQELNAHLTLHSFIIGYSLTLADLAVWGALRGNKVARIIRQKSNCILRWFNFIEQSNPWVTKAVSELESVLQLRKAAASAAGGSYDIGLENVENGVVTRFPPEPSGYLHIGHVKAALLNDHFAHQRADGVLICRFDDTNPSKESEEFQDSILDDLNLLEITPDRISYSSDYFQDMHDLCIKLITDGNAFADDLDKVTMQSLRGNGIASPHREMSVEDTLARFEDMKIGSVEGLRWCIRAKISVDDPNKSMRDPVIYRCNLHPHHRTDRKWNVYPTYDFCAPILDSIEQVTHALRTNDIWDFSRLNFVRTVLSKRKLTTLIEKDAVWGWDDPRMPTVRGIRRRGMTVPALREFILKQGPSQNVVNHDWTKVWAINKKYIDPIAPRHVVIMKEGAVITKIQGIESSYTASKSKHGKNPGLGSRTVFYSSTILIDQLDAKSFKPDEEITLMNWGNAYVRSHSADPATNRILTLNLELHLDGNVKKTEKKITWLAKETQNLVPVELVDFDYIVTKDKIEKTDDISDFITPHTEFRTEGWADCNVASLAEGDIIQFERNGYFRVDTPFKEGQSAVLFNIPTGKSG
ncbi:hypothetical protein FQN54_006240 [Arachnomyces sp. PD_36]|nr:hypothetical protein FQN54_006240 [Arachnomyces sp. PD_36]